MPNDFGCVKLTRELKGSIQCLCSLRKSQCMSILLAVELYAYQAKGKKAQFAT